MIRRVVMYQDAHQEPDSVMPVPFVENAPSNAVPIVNSPCVTGSPKAHNSGSHNMQHFQATSNTSMLPTYEVRSCWNDIVSALNEARDFIYVTGWSVYPFTELERPGGISIGKLLKERADAGVNVCMLIWDDRYDATPVQMCFDVLDTD